MGLFRYKIVSIAIRGILCSGLSSASALMATQIYARQVASTQQYQIPAASLDQVLARFVSQSGVNLDLADASGLQQINSQGLNGRYTRYQGLQQILQGTPYRLEKTKAGYRLSNEIHDQPSHAASTDQVTQLPAIVVKTQQGVTEGSGSYTTDSMSTATKLNLSVRETPQMVKVYTEQYLDDANIDNLKDLMRNATGVSVLTSAENLMVYMRGFDTDVMLVDGQRAAGSIQEALHLSMYDHVELLKGAAGLVAGQGEPGGAVNLIRKQAYSKALSGSISSSYGSWDNYTTGVDLSAGLNPSGSIRGRIVLTHEDGDSFLDHYHREQNVAYGTLAFDLSPRTLVNIGAYIDDHDRDGVRNLGLPAFHVDGSRTTFGPSYNFSEDWTYNDYSSVGYFLNFKHQFANKMQLKLSYDLNESKQKYNLTSFTGQMVKATGAGVGNLSYALESERSEKQAFDVNLSIPFRFNALEQEVLIGYSRAKNKYPIDHVSYSRPRVSSTVVNNALNFYDLEIPTPGAITGVSHDEFTQTDDSAFYLSAKLHLLDPLKLVLGARLTDWSYVSDSGEANRDFNDNFSPYIGVIYDLNKTYSVYASFTDIFQPQDYQDINGHYLDPEMGNNYEFGIKAEYFGGRLNATLSLFRIEKDNVAEAIEYIDAEGNAQDAYRETDGVVSQGGELEIDGQITDKWNVSFGYSHFNMEDPDGEIVSAPLNRTSVNLFSTYRLNHWYFGGGANFRSKFYRIAMGTRVQQEGFTVVNLMAGYQFNKNLKAQLNVNNVFDEEYYENIGPYMLNYGATRNATLSLKYSF